MKFLAILAIAVLMGASSAKAEDGFDLSVVDVGDYYADYTYDEPVGYSCDWEDRE